MQRINGLETLTVLTGKRSETLTVFSGKGSETLTVFTGKGSEALTGDGVGLIVAEDEELTVAEELAGVRRVLEDIQGIGDDRLRIIDDERGSKVIGTVAIKR